MRKLNTATENTSTIFALAESPNHNTKSGASAMRGIVLTTSMNGRVTASSRL